MLKFSERTGSWNRMMLSPSKTAALHAKRKELSFLDGLENFGTPVIMIYLPLLLITLALSGNFDAVYLAAVLFSIAATTLGVFMVSGVFAIIAFAAASLLGGKASLGRLYYMTSLAAAPTFVFTLVMNIASLLLRSMAEALSFPSPGLQMLQLAGDAVAVSVTIYGFYLMTVSIDALYRFGRPRSVATWLAPAAALIIVGATLLVTDLFGILKFLARTLW